MAGQIATLHSMPAYTPRRPNTIRRRMEHSYRFEHQYTIAHKFYPFERVQPKLCSAQLLAITSTLRGMSLSSH